MGEITMAQALNRAIDEAMAEDSGVFCLGEDVGAKQGGGVFKITAGLTEKYGSTASAPRQFPKPRLSELRLVQRSPVSALLRKSCS